ncbi:MAG: hypothetical protein SFV54_19700 [Bryobacteraceae bacterium]|nr:hypothetical protein [Bryobacteraceae bacterium]
MRSILLMAAMAAAAGAQVTVRFSTATPEAGPFPSDAFTVPDERQKTGLRVNLPVPNCREAPTDCAELQAVNELDGFNRFPRMRVSFSSPVNVDTLRHGIVLIALENLTEEEYGINRYYQVIPINQPVWDPFTNTASFKPDSHLDQHRRYLLVVTGDVRDLTGASVRPAPEYTACLEGNPSLYCRALERETRALIEASGPQPPSIAAAALFTTMSTSAWLESARAALGNAPLGFERPAGRSVFPLAEIARLTYRRQVSLRSAAPTEDFSLPIGLVQGVRALAFGAFRSPRWLGRDLTIPHAPTRERVALPAAAETIGFHAWLPSSAKPANGYPTIIFGHGLGDSRFGGPSAAALTMVPAGFAVAGINAFGHGSGPESRVTFELRDGTTVNVGVAGRGVDFDGDGQYGPYEGCIVPGPVAVVLRDCLRQTALDLMQFTRLLRQGLDIDGDGTVDFDPSRIYYMGQSLGSLYGTVFSAVEADVPISVLMEGGGTVVELARLSRSYRDIALGILRQRNPPVLDTSGNFDDEWPLRYREVRVLQDRRAALLQEVFERMEWIQASGDPVSYAPHLKSSTLPGVPIKSVLWMYGIGDETVPNVAHTAVVRAANMRDTTRVYRHDVARTLLPRLPRNAHAYTVNVLDLAAAVIALASQQEALGFFQSGGRQFTDANPLVRPVFGRDLFESPAFLTEDLNYPPLP